MPVARGVPGRAPAHQPPVRFETAAAYDPKAAVQLLQFEDLKPEDFAKWINPEDARLSERLEHGVVALADRLAVACDEPDRSGVVHELGHAMAARAYGLRVHRITLQMLGGVTETTRQDTAPGRQRMCDARARVQVRDEHVRVLVDEHRVAAVQGGGPQGTHANDTSAEEVLQRHLAATEAGGLESPDETGFHQRLPRGIRQATKTICRPSGDSANCSGA